MEEVKRKRGRPRKVQVLPENIEKLVQEIEEREEELVKEEFVKIKNEVTAAKEWDVALDEPIEFFDSELSYEKTGYKPITKTKGLDFNPEWFTEVRDAFLRTGHYCKYPKNSKPFRDFWDREYIRCREGMTVNGYTITGDNYYFLNYYRLMDLTNTDKAGGGRLMDFPRFLVKQYEYFHYVELCKRERKNAIGLKARGVGFSEIGAAIAVNTYNARPNTVTVLAAQQEIYVNKTLDKCWEQLNFLNGDTGMGFFKLRQVEDRSMTKRASVYKTIEGQKVESGWKSEITGITADKPNKIRGDRTDLLIYEESGSWPDWKRAFEQGDALVGIQGQRFGIKMAWGTGGDRGHALAGLAKAYEEPTVYDALPYRHNYTPSGESTISGYFIPSYAIITLPDYLDKRGWTDPEKGKEYYNRERDKKAKDPETLIIHCAEYCFTADEALSLEGVNNFNKVKIANQIAKIRLHKEAPEIEHGDLQYTFKGGVKNKENISGFKWTPNRNGKIHILEHPEWTLIRNTEEDEEKYSSSKMRNLYVAGIDSIDLGMKDTSEATRDPSDFCIVIKRRMKGLAEPQYVAYYKDRPHDVREAYKTAIRLLEYYNCKCVVEASRTNIVSYARDHDALNLFMKRPRATQTDIRRGNSKQYGAPATVNIIEHYLELVAAFIEDYCDNIWFIEFLEEMNRYTYENKGKFDIIAAMGMCELGDEELSGIRPVEVDVIETSFEDVGYYFDEYGIKRFGIIPKNQQHRLSQNQTLFENDNQRNRTSNPRYN